MHRLGKIGIFLGLSIFTLLYGKTEIEHRTLGHDSLFVQVQFIPDSIQIPNFPQHVFILSPACFDVTTRSENVRISSVSPIFQDYFESSLVYDLSNDGQMALMPQDMTSEEIQISALGEHRSQKVFLIRVPPRLQYQWLKGVSFICTSEGIQGVATDSIYPFEPAERTLGKTDSFVPLKETRWRAPALKIWIQKEGWYFIPYSMFVKAGWDVSGINPRNLHLLNSRGEIPIRVLGEEDASFDFTDGVEFYGEPLWDFTPEGEKRLNVFSNANVYWLQLEDRPGLRLGQEHERIEESKQKEFLECYMYSQHEEKDFWRVNLSYSDVFDIDNAEYFVYGGISGGQSTTWEFHLDAPDLYATELAKIRIKVRGQTQLRDRQPFDVLVNNRLVLSESWFENTGFIFESKEFSPLFLKEGKNTITVINRSVHEEQAVHRLV